MTAQGQGVHGGPLLAAERLTKRYGDVVALDGVSFTIAEGVTGILGENGAGKSTAIRIFLGLLPPTSGSATVLGRRAWEDVEVRARLGYMPEHDCLPTHVSAAEFLTHMAEVSGLPSLEELTSAAKAVHSSGSEGLSAQVMWGSSARDALNATIGRLREAGVAVTNLELLPGCRSFHDIEILAASDESQSATLRQHLASGMSAYDFVLIDTFPLFDAVVIADQTCSR